MDLQLARRRTNTGCGGFVRAIEARCGSSWFRPLLSLTVFVRVPTVELAFRAVARGHRGDGDPPFNHVAPASWLPAQPDWVNETLRPEVSPADPYPTDS